MKTLDFNIYKKNQVQPEIIYKLGIAYFCSLAAPEERCPITDLSSKIENHLIRDARPVSSA